MSSRLFRLPLAAMAALVALAPVTLAAQLPAAAPARTITLDEALRLAQQNAPALVQARGAMRSNAAQVRRNLATFLPSLNLTGSSGRSGGVQFFQGELVPYRGDAWSFSNGLSANLELFDGGQRFADLRAARARVDASEASEVAQRFNTALNVKQQFYNVIAARESETAARQQLEQAQQQLAVSVARVRAGAATKSDSLRTAIQVGNARLQVLTAQNNINVANAALTRLVGTTFVVTADSVSSLEDVSFQVDSATLAGLVVEAPAIRQAQADLSAAKASVKSAKTAWLPSISASYSFSSSASAPGFETGKLVLLGDSDNPNSKRLNFNFSYPLFNQLQRETAITTAQVSERNAEASLRDSRLAAQQTLTQTLGALRLAQERIAIQQASVVAGEEDLRVQTERYQLGAATLLDVLTSQTTLNQSRVALIQARLDARVAKAQLEALVGRDL